MARDAGALSVTFASAAPPVRYPHVYGINMPSRHELVAYGRTIPEIFLQQGEEFFRSREQEMTLTALDDTVETHTEPRETPEAPAAASSQPEPAGDEPAEQRPRRRKSRKPAVPAWEDVLLGVRSNGNS